MPTVKDNVQIGPQNWKMRIHTPKLVKKAKPGQFVILRVNKEGERVPMSIAGLDKENDLLVSPDIIADNTRAPFRDGVFDCVLFDPPFPKNVFQIL